MNLANSLITPLLGLIYPKNCKICGNGISNNYSLCAKCTNNLGMIGINHPFLKDWNLRLYARFPIMWYLPLFDVALNDVGLNVIKAIKYQDAPELAQFLGRCLGENILKSQEILPEIIIPVPLHKEKERRRGYNQAEQIAIGISDVTGISVKSKLCVRRINTKTQTKMNRWQRMKNVDGVFECLKPDEVGKSALLCDDVLTTGSTIEGLKNCLPKSCKVAVATLGVA